MRNIFFTLFFLLLTSCNNDVIVNPSETFTQVPIIDIYASQDELNTLLANHMFNAEISVQLFYKGNKYNTILRAQGAGSRYHPKWSYKIKMQNNERIENLSEFNLSAQIFDRAFLSTTLASKIYRDNGFDVFQSNHVFIRINGEDKGLYLLTEKVDEDFFIRRNINVYELFKVGFGAQFTFSVPNFPEFHFDKEIPDNENFNTLRDFIYALDTIKSENIYPLLNKFLDVDNYLEYHAITTIINNFDAFTNNFYLLKKEVDSPFRIIPWDFDKVFETENTIKGIYGENDIIKKIFSIDTTRLKYLEIFEDKLQILDMNYLENTIDSTASFIREAYNADEYLGNGRYNFDQEILQLKNYIQQRKFFLSSLLKEYR